MGPRNCIGMRLALHESMIAMAHVLKRARFVVCDETQVGNTNMHVQPTTVVTNSEQD
jgi:cytochrome P450